MKISKRLLALILVLCMAIPSFTVSAEFKDVPSGVAYYDAVNLLSALKIIQGYPDGTFAPENDVTRAEFTTLLIRAMNLETLAQSANLANFPFTDCTSAGIAYALPNIKLAYEKEIILGMGEKIFAPEEKVTYEQAVKMIVCAAGYEVIANDNGGWPNGYLTAGREMRILDSVNGQIGVAAKRWQIAQLIYNAFPVELMIKGTSIDDQKPVYTHTKDKTWLSEYLGMTRDTGMFVADPITSIGNSNLTARLGECVIALDSDNEETLFKTGTCAVDGLVGKSVEIYYKVNRTTQEKTLQYIDDRTRSNASTTINVEDLINFQGLDPFKGGKLEYWKNSGTSSEKKDNISISSNPTFVLNGKIYTPSSKAEFNEEMGSLISGQIEFIDSDSAGSYDKIFITKVETYVVSKNTLDTVTNTARVITDKYRTPAQNNTYTIDENDGTSVMNIVNQNGTKITAADIGVWNVVEVKESKNDTGRNLVNVTVVNNKISGTVTEVTTEGEVEIANKTYKLSPYYEQYAKGNSSDNELSLGDTATFYLDSKGEIAAVDKQDVTVNYGYIYNMGMSGGELSTDDFIIQMRKSNGTLAQFDIKNKISYDGSTKTPSDGYNYLQTTALKTNYDMAPDDINDDMGFSQIVKYTLDSSGGLKTIITVNQPSDKVSTTSLTQANIAYGTNADGSRKPLKYDSESSVLGNFAGSDGKKIEVNSSTIIYLVSPERSDSTVRIGSISSNLLEGQSYLIEAFDVDASLAKAIVVYTANTLDQIDFGTPISIVTAMKSALNSNTQSSAAQFDAFQVSTSFLGLKSGIWANSTDALDDVQPGDVIKTVTDENGDVRSGDGVVKVWDVNASETPSENEWVNKAPVRKGSYYYQTIVGYIDSVNSDKTRITIAKTADKANIADAERISFDISNIGGYLIYNGGLEKPVSPKDGSTKLTFDDAYTVMQPYETNPDNPTEVLIQMVGGSSTSLMPKLLYVIQRQ